MHGWMKTTGLRVAAALVVAAGLATGAFGQDHEDHEDSGAPEQGYSLKDAPFHVQLTMECRFATECREDEPCAENGYGVTLNGDAGGLDEGAMVVSVVMSSETGDTEIVGVRDAGAMSLSGGSFDARHLLTVAPDGTARYTVHYSDGPQVVSYLGRCEAEE